MELAWTNYLTKNYYISYWSHGAYGVYAGLDCAYAGAGRTNSSAIVGGDIARLAANAVVGAVTGRLSAAMSNNSDTAAHMSYSANGNGIGMAANHIVGGLSIGLTLVVLTSKMTKHLQVCNLTVIIMMEMHLLVLLV